MARRIFGGQFPEALVASSPTSEPQTRHNDGDFHGRHSSERSYIDFHRYVGSKHMLPPSSRLKENLSDPPNSLSLACSP